MNMVPIQYEGVETNDVFERVQLPLIISQYFLPLNTAQLNCLNISLFLERFEVLRESIYVLCFLDHIVCAILGQANGSDRPLGEN